MDLSCLLVAEMNWGKSFKIIFVYFVYVIFCKHGKTSRCNTRTEKHAVLTSNHMLQAALAWG